MSGPRNLAQEAHDRIISMILDGLLQPGDLLQEAALGERLSMSRTPVREAIKRIESEGLAEADGRFTRVRRLAATEIDEIFFLRLALEPACARAAVGLLPQQLDEMERRLREVMAAAPRPNGVDHRIDDAFHELLTRAAGNRTVTDVVAALRRRTCMFDYSQVPERFVRGCEEHLEILAAIRAGDAAEAEAKMIRHLENARDAILARLQQRQTAAETTP